MPTEVRFPCHPDSVKERPFLPEVVFRRTGEGIEIGVMNQRGYDYAWAVVPRAKLDAALSLLAIEDTFEDA